MEREINAIGVKAPVVVSSEPLSSEDVGPEELAASVKEDDLPVFDAAAKALADLQDIYGSGLGDSEIRLLDEDGSTKVLADPLTSVGCSRSLLTPFRCF